MQKILCAFAVCCLSFPSFAQHRIMLTAPTTFYMDAMPNYQCPNAPCVYGIGDDANDGLTPQTPWATFAHATNVISTQYDLGCQPVNLQLAAAPTGGVKMYLQHLVIPPLVGQCPGRRLRGCTVGPDFLLGTGTPAFTVSSSNPSNLIGAFIQPPFHGAGQPTSAAITVLSGADAKVDGIAIDSSVSNSDGLDLFGDTVLGQVLWGLAGANFSVDVAVGPHAWVLVDGPLQANGGAAEWANLGPGARLDMNNNGQPQCAVQFTFGGAVNYTAAFIGIADGATAYMFGVNWVNKNYVTGKQALLAGHADLIINGGGGVPSSSYLPGNGGIQILNNYLPTGVAGALQQAPTSVMIR